LPAPAACARAATIRRRRGKDPLPRRRRVLPRLPTPRSRLRGDPGRGDPGRGGKAPSPGFAGYSPDSADDSAGAPSPGFAGYSPDSAADSAGERAPSGSASHATGKPNIALRSLIRVGHPIFARFYAWTSPSMDRGGVAEHRRRLLAGLSGSVIEVGAGN